MTLATKLRVVIFTLLLCCTLLPVSAQQREAVYEDLKIVREKNGYTISYNNRLATLGWYDQIDRVSNTLFVCRQQTRYYLLQACLTNKRPPQISRNDQPIFEVKVPRLGKQYLRLNYLNSEGYDQIEWQENHTFAVRRGKSHGIINQYGSTIIPCSYEEIRQEGNLYLVKRGNHCGVINQYGSTLIPCSYEEIQQEGNLYRVRRGNSYGLVNQYGSTLIPCNYELIEKRGNLYLVGRDKYYGLINQYGSTIIPCSYEEIQQEGNHYRVRRGNNYGLVNQYGSTIIPCSYVQINRINNTYFVERNGQYGVVNQYGSTILPCNFDHIELLGNGHYQTRKNGRLQRYNAHGSLMESNVSTRVVYSTEEFYD